MELVNGQGATNEAGTEDGSIDGNELPHGRVVVGENLQFCVEVAVEVHEPCKRGGGVTGGHGLEGIVDLGLVSRADAAVEHNLVVSVTNVAMREHVGRNDRLADGEEVRAETANEPLDENLEHSCGDEGVEETDSGVVDIPERAHADLADEEHGEGDEESHKCGCPDGDDLMAERVGELGVDDLSIGEDDGETPRWRRISKVHTETDGTKNHYLYQRIGAY